MDITRRPKPTPPHDASHTATSETSTATAGTSQLPQQPVTQSANQNHNEPRRTDAPAPTRRRRSRLSLRRPTTRKGWAILIASIIGIVAAVGALAWLVWYMLMPAHVNDIQLRRALSSRTTDAPVKQQFKVGEPIMLAFHYDQAKPQTSAKVEIRKDNTLVRSVDLPYLRGDASAPASGQRFVSIVNGVATKLDVGHYTVTIFTNNVRVGSISFDVTT